MTLHYVASQLHSLSVAGYFNREKFTVARLEKLLSDLFRTGDSVTLEIALPDGWWYFTVSRYAPTRDGFDYFIPDTREQSDRLLDALLKRSQ